MRRRDILLGSVAAGASGDPRPVAAQTSRMPTVTVLAIGQNARMMKARDTVAAELARLGWVESQTIRCVLHGGDGRIESLGGVVDGLLKAPVDVIVAIGGHRRSGGSRRDARNPDRGGGGRLRPDRGGLGAELRPPRRERDGAHGGQPEILKEVAPAIRRLGLRSHARQQREQPRPGPGAGGRGGAPARHVAGRGG